MGVAVYLIDRPATQLAFLPPAWFRFDGDDRLFGVAADSLPDLLHVFGFAMLTGALFRAGRRPYRLVCTGWAVIDLAFELGQWPPLAARIAAMLLPMEYHNPEVFFVRAYFQRGVFDPADMTAIVSGAAAAYLTLRATSRWRGTT